MNKTACLARNGPFPETAVAVPWRPIVIPHAYHRKLHAANGQQTPRPMGEPSGRSFYALTE
eukprot:8007796-Lingulodinium_polyedra.AAC.1